MITLPYPTAAPTRESGQTDGKDAKDATGRIDATYRMTAAGMPVLVLDPAGVVWLVTVSNYRGRRKLWWVGPSQECFYICRRLDLVHVGMEPCAVIDELLTDEGETPCC